jgi:hypothetical protein
MTWEQFVWIIVSTAVYSAALIYVVWLVLAYICGLEDELDEERDA